LNAEAAAQAAQLAAAMGEHLGLEGFRGLELHPVSSSGGGPSSLPARTPSAQGALAPLRDVAGVQGSFVVTDLGRLVGRDLPAFFDNAVLAEVGPRALRLRELFARGDQGPLACTLQYTDHLLLLRPLRDGLLCVLADSGVNVLAARMAMNLATRELRAALDRPAS
jgi:predicted regulator of Ras-like GTPase activity (Roadblock/LC7/MglB family)